MLISKVKFVDFMVPHERKRKYVLKTLFFGTILEISSGIVAKIINVEWGKMNISYKFT